MPPFLAFLLPAAMPSKTAVVEAPVLPKKPPEFKAKWWYSKNRLDARPVIWSLVNHPEEWEQGYMTLRHKPSGHVFWTSSTMGYRLNETMGCSCSHTSRKFQLGQGFLMGHAVRGWLDSHTTSVHDQFRDHFVHV